MQNNAESRRKSICLKKKAVFFRRSSASSVYVDQDGRFFGVKQLKATYRCAPTGARVYQSRVYTPKSPLSGDSDTQMEENNDDLMRTCIGKILSLSKE